MNKAIGIIGCGQMGSIIAQGLLETIDPNHLSLSRHAVEKLETFKTQGVFVTDDNIEVAKRSQIIFIAVKPNQVTVVLEQIKTYIDASVMIVSMAAGVAIERIATIVQAKIVRMMPNTPCLVKQGCIALCGDQQSIKTVTPYLTPLGHIEIIEEKLFSAFVGIAGSSPAYIYMMIEAMADGAVKVGMPRDKAYQLAAQSMIGAATMVLQTGLHPGVLKDQVTSPAGTTIAAVAMLEKLGIRHALIEAVVEATNADKEMGK